MNTLAAAITQDSGYNTLREFPIGGVTVLKNGLALIATMTGLLMTPAAASDVVLLPARRAYRGEPGVRKILALQGAGKIRRLGAIEGRDCRRGQGRGVYLCEHGASAGAGGSEKERTGRAV